MKTENALGNYGKETAETKPDAAIPNVLPGAAEPNTTSVPAVANGDTGVVDRPNHKRRNVGIGASALLIGAVLLATRGNAIRLPSFGASSTGNSTGAGEMTTPTPSAAATGGAPTSEPTTAPTSEPTTAPTSEPTKDTTPSTPEKIKQFMTDAITTIGANDESGWAKDSNHYLPILNENKQIIGVFLKPNKNGNLTVISTGKDYVAQGFIDKQNVPANHQVTGVVYGRNQVGPTEYASFYKTDGSLSDEQVLDTAFIGEMGFEDGPDQSAQAGVYVVGVCETVTAVAGYKSPDSTIPMWQAESLTSADGPRLFGAGGPKSWSRQAGAWEVVTIPGTNIQTLRLKPNPKHQLTEVYTNNALADTFYQAGNLPAQYDKHFPSIGVVVGPNVTTLVNDLATFYYGGNYTPTPQDLHIAVQQLAEYEGQTKAKGGQPKTTLFAICKSEKVVTNSASPTPTSTPDGVSFINSDPLAYINSDPLALAADIFVEGDNKKSLSRRINSIARNV
jgi:hypothetical protein